MSVCWLCLTLYLFVSLFFYSGCFVFLLVLCFAHFFAFLSVCLLDRLMKCLFVFLLFFLDASFYVLLVLNFTFELVSVFYLAQLDSTRLYNINQHLVGVHSFWLLFFLYKKILPECIALL